eukprot:1139145-Pelagomonas_calceolata.AAC.8
MDHYDSGRELRMLPPAAFFPWLLPAVPPFHWLAQAVLFPRSPPAASFPWLLQDVPPFHWLTQAVVFPRPPPAACLELLSTLTKELTQQCPLALRHAAALAEHSLVHSKSHVHGMLHLRYAIASLRTKSVRSSQGERGKQVAMHHREHHKFLGAPALEVPKEGVANRMRQYNLEGLWQEDRFLCTPPASTAIVQQLRLQATNFKTNSKSPMYIEVLVRNKSLAIKESLLAQERILPLPHEDNAWYKKLRCRKTHGNTLCSISLLAAIALCAALAFLQHLPLCNITLFAA